MAEVTKEDIKTFIDLEKKLQDRIVELSRKFVGIPIKRIEECVNFKIPRCFDTIVNGDDFVTNNHEDGDIYFGVAYKEDGRYMNFNKNVLCLTDAEAERIYQHDQDFRRQEAEEARKKEEAHKAEIAKQVEETEYKQYLALKKKYEGK